MTVAVAPTASREPKVWPFAILLGVCILIGFLISRTHILVNLTNDRTDRAILGASQLHDGESTTGDVVLGDGGIAPVVYNLAVTGPSGIRPPSQAVLSIRRDDGSIAYSGPLPATAINLGGLNPGETVHLHITVSVPAGSVSAGSVVPLDVLFNWGAKPALVWNAWWLWGVGVALVAALAWLYMTLWPRTRQAPG